MKDDSLAEKILTDIENIYRSAMEKGNFIAALRAKELIGRRYGIFCASAKKQPLSLKHLTIEELRTLIQEIEENMPEKN